MMFGDIYRNRRVLVTGHTGFKGSWLVYWLQQMGAEVCGYSLPAPTQPSQWDLLKLDMRSEEGDIRDAEMLERVFADFKPEIVFHLAAQPLVRLSYDEPADTFETNVLGTVRVFDACRQCDSVRAIVNVTSDKCYENREWVWGYRENDPMGGYDPYSASKGCAELVANSYRRSFFNADDYGNTHHILMASCRAGNVIGGGDWAVDRLIPDIMRAVDAGDVVEIRNPSATRPWQHVLEPLSGYLQIGQRLLEGRKEFADGWNFGPEEEGAITVGQVVEYVKQHWPAVRYKLGEVRGPHEANLLKLDISKAHHLLNWSSVWDSSQCFEHTVNWYRDWYQSGELNTADDLNTYIKNAVDKGIAWAQ